MRHLPCLYPVGGARKWDGQMQRLFLAIIILGVLVAILVIGFAGLRRALSDGTTESDRDGGSPMQKVAFALLMALIVYVFVPRRRA